MVGERDGDGKGVVNRWWGTVLGWDGDGMGMGWGRDWDAGTVNNVASTVQK